MSSTPDRGWYQSSYSIGFAQNKNFIVKNYLSQDR